jgi:hypothetical protein
MKRKMRGKTIMYGRKDTTIPIAEASIYRVLRKTVYQLHTIEGYLK